MAPRAPPPAAAAGAGACIDRLMDGRRVNQSSAMTVLPDGLLPAPRPVLRRVQRQELPALPRAHARLDRLQVPQHPLPHLGAPLRPRVHEEERVALRFQPLPARARPRSAPPASAPGRGRTDPRGPGEGGHPRELRAGHRPHGEAAAGQQQQDQRREQQGRRRPGPGHPVPRREVARAGRGPWAGTAPESRICAAAERARNCLGMSRGDGEKREGQLEALSLCLAPFPPHSQGGGIPTRPRTAPPVRPRRELRFSTWRKPRGGGPAALPE